MKRAFKMKLNPGMIDEYKKRHAKVFPELEEQFRLAGVTDYTIWFDENSHSLFGYVVLKDNDIWDNIANTEACRRWWKFMAEIMETNEDFSPVSEELELAYDFIEGKKVD